MVEEFVNKWSGLTPLQTMTDLTVFDVCTKNLVN